jgi:hypothetical protein
MEGGNSCNVYFSCPTEVQSSEVDKDVVFPHWGAEPSSNEERRCKVR